MTRAGSAYVVGPVYDTLFFLLPPLACLLLGMALAGSSFVEAPLTLAGHEGTVAAIVVGIWIHAHLVAVFFRSHGDRDRIRSHPIRFLVVPPLLCAAIASSRHVAVAATVLAAFWDVYHSGAQTFGFARLYDRLAGNPPREGRALDLWLNQVLYAGPILGGVTLFEHLSVLERFDEVGLHALADVPAAIDAHAAVLARAVLVGGVAFVAFYVASYVRLHRRGHRIAWPKVFLLTSTGLCSLVTWAFDPFGVAFLVMNLFHAIQYLALVWATEGRTRLADGASLAVRGGSLALYVAIVATYGTWAEFAPSGGIAWSATLTVSLLHFWYDGFVWSVGKNTFQSPAIVPIEEIGSGGPSRSKLV